MTKPKTSTFKTHPSAHAELRRQLALRLKNFAPEPETKPARSKPLRG